MKSLAAETKLKPARRDGAPADIDRECEIWDWARAAGVSADDLREAVSDSLRLPDKGG